LPRLIAAAKLGKRVQNPFLKPIKRNMFYYPPLKRVKAHN
jgi:hypothetical protein